MEKDYITISEYARLTGVTRQAVYNKIKSGTLSEFTVTVTVNNRNITALRREILRKDSKAVNSNFTDKETLQVTQSKVDDLQRQIDEYRRREEDYRKEINELHQIIKQQTTALTESQEEYRKIINNMQLIEAQRQQIQIAASSGGIVDSGQDPESWNNDQAGKSGTANIKRWFNSLFK